MLIYICTYLTLFAIIFSNLISDDFISLKKNITSLLNTTNIVEFNESIVVSTKGGLYSYDNVSFIPLNSELINLLRKKINEGWFQYIPYDVDEELCYVLRKTEEKKFILPSQVYTGPSGARIDIPFKTNRISEENLMKDKSLEDLFKVYLLNYGQRNIKISLLRFLDALKNFQLIYIVKAIFRKVSNFFK